MQIFVTIVLAVLSSTSISSIVLAILQRKWAKQDKGVVTKEDISVMREQLSAVTENQKLISIDRIRHLVKCYIADGCVDLESKENLVDMYRSYRRLGGNGHLDTIMAELEKLPVIDK